MSIDPRRLELVRRYHGWTEAQLSEFAVDGVEAFLTQHPPDEHLERIVPVLEARRGLPTGLREYGPPVAGTA